MKDVYWHNSQVVKSVMAVETLVLLDDAEEMSKGYFKRNIKA